MFLPPIDVAVLIRDVSASNEAVEDQCLRAYRAADIAARSAWTAELGSMSPRPALNGELGVSWPPRADWSSLGAAVGNGSSFASPDGQLCGLFAVDVAGVQWMSQGRRHPDICPQISVRDVAGRIR